MKISIVCIALLALVSCGKLGEKGPDGKLIPGSSKNIKKETANDVILYNNVMVSYMNDAANKIKSAGDDFGKMTKMTAAKRKEIFMGMAFIGRLPDATKKEDGIILTEGTGLPAVIKEEMIKAVKGTSDAFNSAHEAYKDFDTYLDNEDFKDDDWKKGESLVITLKNSITAFYENQAEAYAIIRPLANDAENKLLEDHPMKEAIIATKTDLAIAESILDLASQEEVDMDAITEKYELLEANLAKHQGLTPELLKEHNKNLFYDGFYESVKEFLGEIRKSKRDGKINASELRSIESDFGSLISRYNSFV